MKNTVFITKQVLQPVEALTVQLPFYYVSGIYFKHYTLITADRNLISFYRNGSSISLDTWQYSQDDDESLSNRIGKDMGTELYEPIEESVFLHMFSEAHRDLFYQVNPNLKPIE